MHGQLWKKQKKQSTCEAWSTLEKQKKIHLSFSNAPGCIQRPAWWQRLQMMTPEHLWHHWLWRKKEKTINLWGMEGLSTPELSKACTCISRLAWWWWLQMTPEHLFCHPGLWKKNRKSNQPVRRGRMDSRAPASLSIARTCIRRPHDNDDSRAPLSLLTGEKKEKTINHTTPLSSLTLQWEKKEKINLWGMEGGKTTLAAEQEMNNNKHPGRRSWWDPWSLACWRCQQKKPPITIWY